MSVIKRFRETLSDIRKQGLEPAVIRVSVEQDMMMDNEGIIVTSVLQSAGGINSASEQMLNLSPPKRLGGIPRLTDLRVPPDTMIFEDANGHELARVTGLAVPTPFGG